MVISLLSVLALGVGVFRGGAGARPDPAARMEAAVTRLRDAALLGRAQLGLYPRADGWIAARRDAAGRWQPEGAPLALPGAALSWQVAGEPLQPATPGQQGAPPVQFAPDGGSTPFRLVRAGLVCTAPAGAGLTCAR